MHVSLPFAYTATVANHGKSTPAAKTLVDWVERDVPEFGSASVTRLAFWNERGVAGAEYRSFVIVAKGETYVELRDGNDDKIRSLPGSGGYLVQENNVIASVMGHAMLTEREFLAMSHAITRPKPKTVAELPRDAESNFQNNRNVALDCVSSLIHFEGAFWKKVPRMGLALRSVGTGYDLEISASPTGFDVRDRKRSYDALVGPGLFRFYPLDEIERAKAHAGSQLRNVRFADLDLWAKPPTFDAERDYVARCLEYAVLKTSGEVGAMDRESMVDWLNMRDTLDACFRNGSEFPDDIHDVIKRFAPTVDDGYVRDNLVYAASHLDNFAADRVAPHAMSTRYNRYFNPRR